MRLQLITFLFLISALFLKGQIQDTLIANTPYGDYSLFYYIPSSYNPVNPPSIIAGFSKSTMENFIPISEEINSVIIGYYPDGGTLDQWKGAIDTLSKWLTLDTNAIYISGFSGRGNISRSWVNDDPDYFKAFIPINAVGMNAYVATPALATVPHCLLCGENDRYTPYPFAPAYHDKILSLGGSSKFVTVPGLGHWDDVPPEYVRSCFEFLLRKSLDGDDLKIFPNPTNGFLEILLNSSEDVSTDIIIYSSLGELIYKGRLNDSYHTLDLSHLVKGVYLVVIPINNTVLSKKLIIY